VKYITPLTTSGEALIPHFLTLAGKTHAWLSFLFLLVFILSSAL
jgi:hypothetical protein